MTLNEFLECYGKNAVVSIDGYCEEERYDYYTIPLDKAGNPDEYELTPRAPKFYQPTCMAKRPWYDEIKNRKVKFWNILDGYPAELYIELGEEIEEKSDGKQRKAARM